MNLFELQLKAGEPNLWSGMGKYLRILKASGQISVSVTYLKGNGLSSELLAGIGVDLRQVITGEGFNSVKFTSAIDQTIQVLVSDQKSDDSRIIGEFEVSNIGGSSRQLNSGNLSASVAQEALSSSATRLKAMLTFTADVYIGVDNTVDSVTGKLLKAGDTWIDENRAPLWVYPASPCYYQSFEDHA